MNTVRDANYYCGISGIQLPVPKYRFPPEHRASTRLQYYSTFFNSLEINSSFYKLPLASTLQKWSQSVSENFKFTLKFWKQVTHQKGLGFDAGDVRKFLTTADGVGNKKRCLLLQLPPGAKVGSIDQLATLLTEVKAYVQNSWVLAVEFRDISWYSEEVYSLMKKLNTTIVMHDKTRSSSLFHNTDPDTLYVRFHGPNGDYRRSYTDEFLMEYSLQIKQWLSKGKTVYVYFNNTMGDAFGNLTRLNKYLNLT